MGFFNKSKKFPGWMSIIFCGPDICVAYIKRKPDGKPVVESLGLYTIKNTSPAAGLDKLAKDLQASRFACTTMLAANEYQLLSVDSPNVPPDEIKTAIRWKVKDMLDFPVDDATIDVLDIPVDKASGVRTHMMYVVAARSQLIEQRQALFAEARIALAVIDIPEMAQRNISALLEPEGRGVALLSFDMEGGLLTVSFSGELYLSRRIDATLAQLQQTDADQRNVCHERITLELQRTLDHFDRQYHFITIARLYLAPVGETDFGLRDYLAQNMYVPVDALDLDTILDFSKVPYLKALDLQQRCFMALGTALRHVEVVL